LKITHISTYDVSGGAARAAYLLHKGLNCIGQKSMMLVKRRKSNDLTVKLFNPSESFAGRVKRLLRRKKIIQDFMPYKYTIRKKNVELFSDDRTQFRGMLSHYLSDSDIVNLHWVTYFLDYQYFFAHIPKNWPVVWTLHDMNTFTGGCHYNNGCDKYLHQCDECPQLGSNKKKDLSHQIWRRKKRVYDRVDSRRLHIVTPSQWLGMEASKSPLLNRFPVTVIPNGIDTDVFVPRNKSAIRAALDIPRNAKVILFVAASIEIHRKGFEFLSKILSSCEDIEGLFLISLGSGGSSINVKVPHLHIDRLNNDYFISLVYSAADLFVIPSIQDNLPNTVLESLSCGIPVVGFNTGGIPDMVRPGITGLLVPPRDVAAMHAAIAELLQNPANRAEMSDNCRRIAVKEYALEVQAHRYVKLYEKILAYS